MAGSRSAGKVDLAAGSTLAGAPFGGGGGGGTSFDVNQTTHGLVVGQPVYYNGTIWVIARADDNDTTADGLVSAVADANNFTYTLAGEVDLTTGEWDAVAGTSGGLTAGEHYRLSSEAPGGLITSTAPSSTDITQFLLRALSTTKGLVYLGEPHAHPGSLSSGGAWEYMKTVEVTVAATTLTVDGLNGDVDERYLFVYDLIYAATGAGGREILLQPNGDAANGRFSRMQWQGGTVTPTESGTLLMLGQFVAQGAGNIQVQGELLVHAKVLASNSRMFYSRLVMQTVGNQPRGMHTVGQWDNSVDNLTSIVFGPQISGDFEPGSYFHVYKLKKNTNAPVAVGGLELIETKVFTVDAATYTFTGLDGDTDEEYVLRGSVRHGTPAGTHNVFIRPNGATTNLSGNYGQLAGAIYSGAALSAPSAWWLSNTSNIIPAPCHVDAHIYAKLTGIGPNRQRRYRNEMSIAAPLFVNATWAETATNLTSLELNAGAGVIGAGTELRLYKVVK